MLRIALTGGIASGKTTVSDLFAELGVPVIDADVAARAVVAPGSAGLQQLVELFGSAIVQENGELNRRLLRERIFADNHARARVNALLHPLIRHHMQQTAATFQTPYCLYVIPLLLETGQADEYDRVVVVHADRATRIARLCQRDQINVAAAEAILAAQSSDEQRLAIADHVIDNDGDRAHVQSQVLQLHQQFLLLATEG